ncbi:hypothetical protein [Bradyrhizobium sp. AZCC 2289]|uniref:hypothetical protein n=1 Tax=Bradyrhizobium sp. AZCC 2289 TaxID=3117026 RepID=UPI002FF36F8B
MAYDKISNFRKDYASCITSGPMGRELTFLTRVDGDDWSDSLAAVIDRMNDLRQFVFDEYLSGDDVTTWQEKARLKVAGIRHVERELKCALHETLFILSDVRDLLGTAELAEADVAINKGDRDTKAKIEGKSNKRSKTKVKLSDLRS